MSSDYEILRAASGRFWSKVEKGPGCWLWTGSRCGSGRNYGQFVAGKSFRAHRVSWKVGDVCRVCRAKVFEVEGVRVERTRVREGKK